MSNYSLAIHGGAGVILESEMTTEQKNAHLNALREALKMGERILTNGGTALDAVEAAVISLEDCPHFNAGRGAVFTNEANHEMDASIMCGKTLDAGAVALVAGVKNPISLSRKVLHHSEHIFLAGKGAVTFAKLHNLPFRDEDWFYSEYRFQQMQQARQLGKVQLDHSLTEEKYGTVGAVAKDQHGNLAAATSTGGLTNKKYGRIGDSPLIGCGTYANNITCAVSCTGFGELFIKGVVAYDISCLMEYRGWSLEQACEEVIFKKQPKIGGDGGLIAVDNLGNIALPFNSLGMYRGWVRKGNAPQVAIEKS